VEFSGSVHCQLRRLFQSILDVKAKLGANDTIGVVTGMNRRQGVSGLWIWPKPECFSQQTQTER
jgi:hypothetical protein